EQVIRAAMQSDDWKAHRKLPPEAYFGEWAKSLQVKLVPSSYVVNVAFTDDHKDGKDVAPIAVRSLLTAYRDFYVEDEKKQYENKLMALRSI
ncbi:hypothetical protein NL533_31065, partial [Klebsiella pneumoniae]|nr:hypothetical protein [Klebsiella pneumoniae]